ncbi:MAG: hypothetical protein N2380_05155 [bacterium]|nr:hypothetical protein [bacterium]
MFDISNCVILTSKDVSGPVAKAITVLIEEVEKRTGIRLPIVYSFPEGDRPVIVVGTEDALNELIKPYIPLIETLERPGKEGYKILFKENKLPIIFILGTDSRGVLYGIGKFLRNLIWDKGSIKIKPFSISSTPKYPLRGHQLGYRPKTNAYDAWSVEQFEQYIRELALFGANSIEILPPRTDDEPTSPHMKIDPLEMMIRLSEIIDSYGLDVWIWYPNMFTEEEYRDENCIKREIEEREEIFSKLKRIDAVFIPGGDPGSLEANTLFEWSEKVYEILNKYHPNAKIWLSPQCFRPTKRWLDDFYNNVRKEPEWLGGIVFGPWVKTQLPELREIIPNKYPIRHYPDITHSLHCQYPVKDWDLSFAITLGRECINPRPKAEKHIHNLFAPYTIGSISYSEGINDDVNKFIWSDQDWNPETPVIETLRDYVRFFITPKFTEEIAQGIMALEENWEGPLLVNDRIDITLKQWQDVEKSVSEEVLNNYRFQMCLLRAYYDAYIRRRLIYETELERSALDILEKSKELGSLRTIELAEEILEKAKIQPVAQDYKNRCWELADKLFKNIGSQLSVERYNAIAWDRGAFMDDIDMPLNNYRWFKIQFERIRKIETEEDRQKAIYEIVNRTNPGPGGFYDNLGNPRSQKRIISYKRWEEDPGYLSSPVVVFTPYLLHINRELEEQLGGVPLALVNSIATLYDTPLVIRYENLEQDSDYRLRVTYIGAIGGKIKLIANERFLIHDFIDTKRKVLTEEFKISKDVITKGELTLKWVADDGERGCEVAEIWLIKEG